MAAVLDNNTAVRRRPGVRSQKKRILRIDMTPMVDLGFLLIAFFVMTTQLGEPRSMRLNMPTDGPPMGLGLSNALTIILNGENQVCYYPGEWTQATAENTVRRTNLSMTNGIGKIIREKQEQLDRLSTSKEGRDGLMLLIKAGPGADYRSIIDAIDETLINSVKKYVLLKAEPEELDYLKRMP